MNTWIAIAASILIIILPVFAYFCSKSIYCPKGQNQTVYLSDNTEVILNADTQIEYYPIRWYLNRSVKLSGEAFFKVKSGSTFKVSSDNGMVEVLGTSFNIMSRDDKYRVTCTDGIVRVTSNTKKSAIITPGHLVDVSPKGEINLFKEANIEVETGWLKKQFSYTSEPLINVIREIERQYNVVIECPENMDYNFSGSFNAKTKVDKVLKIVCKPFLITFTKVEKGRYRLNISD